MFLGRTHRRLLATATVVLALLLSACGKSADYQRGYDAGSYLAGDYLNASYARELCEGLAATDGGNRGDFVDGCMDGWNESTPYPYST